MKPLAILAGLLALSLVGCKGDSTNTAGTAGGEQPGKGGASKSIKVALLTPGPVSDSGWNAMAYEGLVAIKNEQGAIIQNQEAAGEGQIKDAMRQYAQDGYNLVIGHGFEYNGVAKEIAPDFPNTVFVSSSGAQSGPNFGAFRFYLEQGFYLAGMMAAGMSKTGVVAVVGLDVPSIRSTFKGFIAGAKAVRPDIKIVEKYVPLPGTDIAAYKQSTLAAIDEKADFIMHQANQGAQAVFDAAKEKGVLCFGANANQNNNPSGVVIASAVIIAKPAFLDLAKEVAEGKYKGRVQLFGMDKGAIDFVVNPAMADKVPGDLMSKIQQARTEIATGKLVVPKDEF